MDYSQTEKKLELLSANVETLLYQYKELKSAYENTVIENKKLKSLLEEQNEKLNDFQYKAKISKIVQYLAVEDLSAEELRTKIDEYIKEIDNCLAYLSREV
ncbi:hypothetical protein [Chondrinema litorale]|uniref:hypothetical protein n=1 Tax=Chondrinema litorale TaxID=2994555 RepID=UPI000C4A0570|nr:hypothetical protein [Chondrinema litorale]MBT31204.1 hypothetical protein [Thalassovita sp.]UZR92569.1 hypothetical protein OQ292_11925 [Chondrinema litorale]